MKADKPQYLNDKLVNVFVQFGHDPDADAKGVASALDVITDAKDRQVAKLILANLELSRPFVAPPGLPADRAAALRKAFLATAADPAFLAVAARTGREISVFTADEIDGLLRESYALPPEIIRRAAEISAGR
jgi:hypothetical protein